MRTDVAVRSVQVVLWERYEIYSKKHKKFDNKFLNKICPKKNWFNNNQVFKSEFMKKKLLNYEQYLIKLSQKKWFTIGTKTIFYKEFE